MKKNVLQEVVLLLIISPPQHIAEGHFKSGEKKRSDIKGSLVTGT